MIYRGLAKICKKELSQPGNLDYFFWGGFAVTIVISVIVAIATNQFIPVLSSNSLTLKTYQYWKLYHKQLETFNDGMECLDETLTEPEWHEAMSTWWDWLAENCAKFPKNNVNPDYVSFIDDAVIYYHKRSGLEERKASLQLLFENSVIDNKVEDALLVHGLRKKLGKKPWKELKPEMEGKFKIGIEKIALLNDDILQENQKLDLVDKEMEKRSIELRNRLIE